MTPEPTASPSAAPAARDWKIIKSQFMLDPDRVYLNNGSFSALPRPVFEAQVRLMAEAEADPTRIGLYRGFGPLWRAQGLVASYLGCDPHDLVLHTNVTQALNQVLMGLNFKPGADILISSHEYGAIHNLALYVAGRRGLNLKAFDLPGRPDNNEQILDSIRSALTPATAAVIFSHVTCTNGLVLPVEQIGQELSDRDIVSIIDGAHAPGLIDVDLGRTRIDFYGGNLHKWVMGPKGTAFLYVRRERRNDLSPYTVGWGSTPDDTRPIHDKVPGLDDRFQYVHKRAGCHDYSPMLAMEATLQWRREIGEVAIRGRLRELLAHTRSELQKRVDLPLISPCAELNAGLIAVAAPEGKASRQIVNRVYNEQGVTLAAIDWPRRDGAIRFSPHICNDESDIDRGITALLACLG